MELLFSIITPSLESYEIVFFLSKFYRKISSVGFTEWSWRSLLLWKIGRRCWTVKKCFSQSNELRRNFIEDEITYYYISFSTFLPINILAHFPVHSFPSSFTVHLWKRNLEFFGEWLPGMRCIHILLEKM